MADLLVIGLPKAVQLPIDLLANVHELVVARVYAEIGREGRHVLLPKPEHCILSIRDYVDSHGADRDDYNGARILILPYADIPDECQMELEVVRDMGADIEYASTEGDQPWPKISRRTKDKKEFHDALKLRFQKFFDAINSGTDLLSSFILRLSRINTNLLIAENALETCDEVDGVRHEFVRKAVTALADAASNGLQTRFDHYCSELGLQHAQSGGSKFTVNFFNGGRSVDQLVCYTHLKSGDKTTPQAAARVYYTFYESSKVRYAALLYAGIHPEGDYSRKIELP